MRIEKIVVHGLFNIFHHEIPLNLEEGITIIHGPNGFGKTTILKMVDALFNMRFATLREIPFLSFEIYFDDQSCLKLIKEEHLPESSEKSTPIQLKYLHNPPWKIKNSLDDNFEKIRREDTVPLSIIERRIPTLTRIDRNEWKDMASGEILNLEDIEERYGDIISISMYKPENVPEWFKELKKNLQLRFIQAQRLLSLSKIQRATTFEQNQTAFLSVTKYAKELSTIIKSTLAEYATLSQSLDRTFPSRVVSQSIQTHFHADDLRIRLSQLEEKRTRYIEVGLLDKDEKSDFQIPSEIDEKTISVLAVYIEDVEKKLSVLDILADKIDIFKKVLDPRFKYKNMIINKETGFKFTTSNGSELFVGDLSSGEQHELVLLYELLFKIQPGSLILIDEPELSLHIAWQEEFLKDLQEIIRLGSFDVLIATHSPQIVDDKWDWTVELKGPEKMREYLKPEVIANKIRMKRSQFKGAILVVEGVSDKNTYSNFVNLRLCHFEIAHGKMNALKIIEILTKDNFQGVLAIVDSDFMKLDGSTFNYSNIFHTDTHDLETMILESTAFDKFIVQFASEEKILKLPSDIRTILLRSAAPLGFLRYISLKEPLNLKFEALAISNFIDKNTLENNLIKMIQTVKNNSQRHDLNEGALLNKINTYLKENHNYWDICCGHDLIQILCLGLQKLFASYNSNELKQDYVEKILRTAYDISHFQKTELYKQICEWQERNTPYQIVV